MALQDFTISFTTTEVVEFNDLAKGSIGPASTIFADISSFEKIGPASTIFADIAAFHKISPASTISASGFVGGPALQPVELLIGDIIHYNDVASFKANEIVLPNDIILRGNGDQIQSWAMNQIRLNVIDTKIDRVLNQDESKSVCINNGAGSDLLLSLPEGADVGTIFTVIRTSTSGNVNVDTENNTGSILYPSGIPSSGVNLTSIGSKLSVISAGSNRWAVINFHNVSSGIL